MGNLPLKSAERIHAGLLAISVSLFTIYVLATYPIDLGRGDFLGLVAHLTPIYWIGLFLVSTSTVLLIVSNEPSRFREIALANLFVMCVYLVGVWTFAVPGQWYHSVVYSAELQAVVRAGSLNALSPSYVTNSRDYPAYIMISGFLNILGGWSFWDFAKFGDFLFLFVALLIPFGIRKWVGLTCKQAYLVSLVLLMGFYYWIWWYSPEMYGMLASFFIIPMALSSNYTRTNVLVFALFFASLVLNDPLVTTLLMLPLVMLTITKREYKKAFLMVGIFIAWQSNDAFSALVQQASANFLDPFKSIELIKPLVISQQFIPNPLHQIINDVRLVFPAILGGLVAASIVSLALRRFGHLTSVTKGLLILFIGFAPDILVTFGAEITIRIYTYALFPIGLYIAIMYWRRPKFIAVVFVILLCFYLPARYGGSSFETTPVYDNTGSSFVAHNALPRTYAYEEVNLIGFFNSSWIYEKVPRQLFIDPSSFLDVNLTYSPNIYAYYVIVSEGSSRLWNWSYGNLPTPESVWVSDGNRSLVYNNGGYAVYVNPKPQ